MDGDGKLWWDKYWKMRREEYEPKGLRWAVDYNCQRPRLIQVYKVDQRGSQRADSQAARFLDDPHLLLTTCFD